MRRSATILILLAVLVVGVQPARAQAAPSVVNVPAGQPTIQAGIDAVAVNGTVIVAAGVYRENVDDKGKAVEVRSAGGPETTVIDGGGAPPTVSFQTGELRTSVLRGFTVRNGANEGGVWVKNAGPVITGNIISGNTGAGVTLQVRFEPRPGPLVQGNIIRNNTGAGIAAGSDGDPEILDNVIEHNGGGIDLFATGEALVRNNIVRFNGGQGLSIANHRDALIVGNVIAWNGYEQLDVTVPTGDRGPYFPNNTFASESGVAVKARLDYGASGFWNNVIYAGGGGP